MTESIPTRFEVLDERFRAYRGDSRAECDAGTFDGLRLDTLGRIWAAAHDGVHCIDPDGTLLGKLHLPEVTSNLTFGGAARNVLFMTATTSVYALRMTATGLGTGPYRAGAGAGGAANGG